MDKQKQEIKDFLIRIRRYMKHDVDCSIWRDVHPICDCGLDAVLRRAPKLVSN